MNKWTIDGKWKNRLQQSNKAKRRINHPVTILRWASRRGWPPRGSRILIGLKKKKKRKGINRIFYLLSLITNNDEYIYFFFFFTFLQSSKRGRRIINLFGFLCVKKRGFDRGVLFLQQDWELTKGSVPWASAVRRWAEMQDGQRILLTTPSVLVGFRVEVYRAEGTTQWYTAVIVGYNESTKVNFPKLSARRIQFDSSLISNNIIFFLSSNNKFSQELNS